MGKQAKFYTQNIVTNQGKSLEVIDEKISNDNSFQDQDTTYNVVQGGALDIDLQNNFDLSKIHTKDQSYGPTSDSTSNSIKVPNFTVDQYGRIVSGKEVTITVPTTSSNSDSAVLSKAANSSTVTISSGGSGGVTFGAGSGISLDVATANQINIANTAPHQATNLSLSGSANSSTLSLSGGGTGSVTIVGGDNVTVSGSNNKVTITAEEEIKNILSVPVATDLNDITAPFAYIGGTPTAAQKAALHYPQTWTITGNPKIITTGGNGQPRTQILHNRTDVSVFYLRTCSSDGWTDWKKFTSDTDYVTGSSKDLNDYLWPGHFIVSNSSTTRITNSPTNASSGYGHPAYLDVYEINSGLIIQQWHFRGETAVSQLNLDNYGGVLCQRFIAFSSSTDSDGNTVRTITYAGEWSFIGAPFVYSSAPSINNCKGRLWYNTSTGTMKIYDGTDWKDLGGGDSMQVFKSTTAPTASVVSGKHNFWVDTSARKLAYYDESTSTWVNFVNP